MARIRPTLSLALAGLVLAAPRLASACQPRTICVNWETEITDDGFGESYVLNDKVRARGAKVTLIPPAPEPPLATFLDQSGCMTFETQFAYGHKLVVYAEAWVGLLPEPVHIRMRRQEKKDDGYQTDFFWIVDLHGLAPNDAVEFPIKGEAKDPIVPLMAITTEVMHRLGPSPGQLDVHPPMPATLFVDFLDWYGNARAGSGFIQVGPDSFREKVIIAHEIGHWLQFQWDGRFGPPSDYSYNSICLDPDQLDCPCRFGVEPPEDLMGNTIAHDANAHGIRSAEFSTPAMIEGFAHFVAAVAFNDFADFDNSADEDGVFRYYKDIDINKFPPYADFMDPQKGNSRVSLLGGINDQTLGGENRWTESQCPLDWQVDEISNGMDWMRFFWHFLTRSGDPPSLRQLLEFFDFVEDNDLVGNMYQINDVNVWPKLREAMDDSPAMSSFSTRFDQANCDMGVYDANTCP